MRGPFLAGLVLALACPTATFGLATEQFGNGPITMGLGLDATVTKAVNVDSRVYWYEVNGNPTFFFKGGSKELNLAIRHFAAIPAEKKEIILLAGPGLTHSLGRKEVPFDWCLHVPGGIHFDGDSEVADTRATLTIHITDPLPAAPSDPAKVKKWIADLNSDEFKVRDEASRQIEALGPSAAGLLREALKGKPSAEARDRLDRLLEKASPTIRLDVLELSADISVVSLETLLKRARKELTNSDHMARGVAIGSLTHRRASPEEILPDLEKFIKDEKHEYPLRCAISSASYLGTVAKPLIPILRERMNTTDENVINVCKYTIDAIEKAKPETPPEAEGKAKAALRAEILTFIEVRAAKSKK
jgi:hypothetical protein